MSLKRFSQCAANGRAAGMTVTRTGWLGWAGVVGVGGVGRGGGGGVWTKFVAI